MAKAREIAAELRKFADRLDRHPDFVVGAPIVLFTLFTKEELVGFAKVVPRPLEDRVDSLYGYPCLRLWHKGDAVRIEASIAQRTVCRLVEPAKEAVYECEPLLSLEEEEEVAE